MSGALALAGAPLHAHDFWITPSAHEVEVGARVPLRLFNGAGAEIVEFPRSRSHQLRFEAHHADGVVPVTGTEGMRPAGSVTLNGEGFHTIVYRSTHQYIELAADRFEAYLAEEGLSAVIAERARLGETGMPGHESYARYAKSLVRVGASATGFDRQIGLPAEVTAVEDPTRGGRVAFRVDFLDAPFAGAHVDLIRVEEARLTVEGTAVSDASGRVALTIPSAGRWMVATTLMRRAEVGVRGDWESFWATLTFGATPVVTDASTDASTDAAPNTAPPAGTPAPGGCGCAASGGGSSSTGLIAAVWFLVRRRRRSPLTRARDNV